MVLSDPLYVYYFSQCLFSYNLRLALRQCLYVGRLISTRQDTLIRLVAPCARFGLNLRVVFLCLIIYSDSETLRRISEGFLFFVVR